MLLTFSGGLWNPHAVVTKFQWDNIWLQWFLTPSGIVKKERGLKLTLEIFSWCLDWLRTGQETLDLLKIYYHILKLWKTISSRRFIYNIFSSSYWILCIILSVWNILATKQTKIFALLERTFRGRGDRL